MTTPKITNPVPTAHPVYGAGLIIRWHGATTAEVLWSGMTLTRRESVADVERWQSEVDARNAAAVAAVARAAAGKRATRAKIAAVRRAASTA